MGRKPKKGVPPEIRRQWLRRYEQDGESPPQIAAADRFDVRTVRRQLELGRQEREEREAKQAVLRHALQRHHDDLCNIARTLSNELGWPPRHLSTFLKEQPLYPALQAHVPRSLLWKPIQKWEALVVALDLTLEELRSRLRQETERRTTLPFTPSFWEGSGLLGDFVQSIVYHLNSLAQGGQGLDNIEYVRDHRDQDLIQIRFREYTLGLVPQDLVDEAQGVHKSLMSEAMGWEEWHKAKDLYAELQQLRDRLQDELATLTLRHVVPGKCRYCPF